LNGNKELGNKIDQIQKLIFFSKKEVRKFKMKKNLIILPSNFSLMDTRGIDKQKTIALESYNEEERSLIKLSEADLFGATLPEISLKGTSIKSVRLRYTKHCKYITLIRYLTGKIVFQVGEIQRIDILLLFDSLVTLQDLLEKEEDFKRKYGSDLESLALILKSFKLHPRTKILDVKKLGEQIEQKIPNFVLPKRNLSTVWKHVQRMYYYSASTDSGTEIKRIPPKGYIGKGYTDKGTARKPELDGSPSWQEVAQFNAYDPEQSL